MSEQTAEENGIINLETVETPVESQENLEPVEPEELTPAEQAFKEKRREENRTNREKAARLDKVEAELEFTKFLRKNPEAEDYEQEINEFRSKNPAI